MGFRVEARHCNPAGVCHGGMLATFVDMLVPCAMSYSSRHERRFLSTISLQIDYLAGARLGVWVEGHAEILRTTRNLVFGQGLVHAAGEPSLRFSGVFKIGAAMGNTEDTDPLNLR